MNYKQTSIEKIPKHCQTIPLSELVYIRSGYTFRQKIEPTEDGNILLIQMSDLDHDLKMLKQAPTKVQINRPNQYQLHSGDILFLGKGTNNYGWVFKDLGYPALASSTFFVLSVKGYQVIPAYLAWYINQPPAQRYLESTLEGTNQRNIKRAALLDLEVRLPPLKQQELIGKLYQLGLREQQLLQVLITKRQQLLRATLLSTIGF